ncbi:MAG: hypothetical protein RSD50_07250, partial [Acinetobacter sp.]
SIFNLQSSIFNLQSSIFNRLRYKIIARWKSYMKQCKSKRKEPKMRDWTKVVELMCLRLFLLKIG